MQGTAKNSTARSLKTKNIDEEAIQTLLANMYKYQKIVGYIAGTVIPCMDPSYAKYRSYDFTYKWLFEGDYEIINDSDFKSNLYEYDIDAGLLSKYIKFQKLYFAGLKLLNEYHKRSRLNQNNTHRDNKARISHAKIINRLYEKYLSATDHKDVRNAIRYECDLFHDMVAYMLNDEMKNAQRDDYEYD